MRRFALTFLVLTGLTLLLVSPAAAPANPAYTLTVNPGVPVSRGTTVTLTLAVSNGQSNSAYTVSIGVTKPNGTGQASTTRLITTDNRGIGSTSIPYPDPSFTPSNGTVATDVGGVYTVNANQTSPTFAAGITMTQFTVTSQLTVVLTQPTMGTFVQRGEKITVTATVSDLSGPIPTATVSANTPPGGKLYLAQISTGVYSGDYQVLMYDPVGAWTIQVSAVDTRGNSGLSSTATVTVTKSELVVDSLAAYNSKGLPSTDFSLGDTIYPFFRVRYSSGNFITSGQFRVAVKDQSGAAVANLTAIYDGARFGFYTLTGYPVSSHDQAGAWSVSVDAGSANDGFGNTGPIFTTSVRVQIVTVTSPLGYLPFAIGGLVAIVSGVVAVKKYGKSLTGFEYLEEVMGGGIPRSSSLLLLGDPGSGKTIFSYQFLFDELENGRQCALLSYDAFPEDIQERMKEFGWDITSHLRKGRLKIVDCYSGLAGEGEGAIKDPSDLTELNIRVTSIITKAKGKPVTLVLDSLTPIFNGVDTKQAILFLQTVSAKIKKTGGIFYMTGTTGAIPSDSLAKVKSIVEGVVELSLVRVHRQVSRYMSVLKMERRKISSSTVPFEIDRRRGIVFRVSRFKVIFSHNARPAVKAHPTKKKEPVVEAKDPHYSGLLGPFRKASDKLWGVTPVPLVGPLVGVKTFPLGASNTAGRPKAQRSRRPRTPRHVKAQAPDEKTAEKETGIQANSRLANDSAQQPTHSD